MTIQTYDFEGQALRDVLIDGEPWFVGKDVCAILGIVNHNDALGSMPDDERKGVGITDPLGRNPQDMICVNEPGLYRLIFKSRKPEAERFKRWVLHEVLPEIRRTGGYGEAAPSQPFTVPVGDYIALLQWKISILEEKARPRTKRPNTPLTDADINTFRHMAMQGMSRSDIARKTGRSTSQVSMSLRACPPMTGGAQ